MKYSDGNTILLGDEITICLAGQNIKAKVVMLGHDYSHLGLEPSFITWVKNEKVLEAGSIIIEWLDNNPFSHNDQQYAPVGNYMFTGIDGSIKLVQRGPTI